MAKEKAKPDYDQAPNNETVVEVVLPEPVIAPSEPEKPRFTLETAQTDEGHTTVVMNY